MLASPASSAAEELPLPSAAMMVQAATRIGLATVMVLLAMMLSVTMPALGRAPRPVAARKLRLEPASSPQARAPERQAVLELGSP